MIDLRIELTGELEVRRILSRTLARTTNLRPAFIQVADDFYRHMERVFATEGAINPSGRWKALDRRYAAWKARRHPGKKILERTGRMKRSLTGQSDEAEEKYTADTLTIGADVPWIQAHQRGTWRLPRRTLIEAPERLSMRWARVFEEHVTG